MAIQADSQLLLSAFVDECRDIGGTTAAALVFAKAMRRAALIGTGTAIADVLLHIQDYCAPGITAEGTSTQWMREMSVLTLATLCQAAVQIFQAEIAAAAAGLTGSLPDGHIHHADFSGVRSTLG